MENGRRTVRPDQVGQRGASPVQMVLALLVLGVVALAVAVAIATVGL